MKFFVTIIVAAWGLATAAYAQTNNQTGSSPATVSQTGPSTATSPTDKRSARKRMKQERKRRKTTTDAANPSDYRQTSADGTAANNSNTTNANTQGAINNPTGVNAAPVRAVPGDAQRVATGSAGSVGSVSAGSTQSAVSGSETVIDNARNAGSKANPNEAVATVPGAGPAKRLSVGDFVAASPNYTTLQNALQAADLSQTLRDGADATATGVYTVFAPSNAAFKKLPDALQKTLLDGQNKDALRQLLSYHVIAGSVDATELMRRIDAGNGSATLQTLAGRSLTAKRGTNNQLTISDEQGNRAIVEAATQPQSNGVVHGLDRVLLPTGAATMFR